MEAIEALISRRSATRMMEPAPDQAALETILRAAIRAPDHGKLTALAVYFVERRLPQPSGGCDGGR
jgi:nitroreductase